MSVNQKIMLAALPTVLLVWSQNVGAMNQLDMFSTDGCSAFPDGSISEQKLWQDCCIAHDLAYWAGGTYADREAADEALAECVTTVGEPVIGKLMLAGVRAGGSPFFPTTFRWGYGWRYLRGYQPLTEEEKNLLLSTIDRAPASAFVPVQTNWYLTTVPLTGNSDEKDKTKEPD